jgi:hypothetical protein
MERTLGENRILMQIEIYPNQQETAFPVLEHVGLRLIKQVEYDFYYTNIDESKLGF